MYAGTLDWEGTIDESAGGKQENYFIEWLDKGGIQRKHDPLIQVKP